MTTRRYVVILSDTKRARNCVWHTVEASRDVDAVTYARNWLALTSGPEQIVKPFRYWSVYARHAETGRRVLIASGA